MQGHIGKVDALGLQLVEQGLVEMQAGRRRGHGAGHLVEDGLVARLVECIRIVFDVRRQRQPAMRLDQLEHVGLEVQGKEFAGALADRHIEGVGQADTATGRRRLRRTHLGQHGALVEHALDQRLDLAAAFLDAKEARFEHARIVHHQQVARLQQPDDVGELAVDQGLAVQMQQARGAALGQRSLRNVFLRQIKIEIGKRIHAFCFKSTSKMIRSAQWNIWHYTVRLYRHYNNPPQQFTTAVRTGCAGQPSILR
ncbi:hypothetical protein D3C87_582740 [compost metagenome]